MSTSGDLRREFLEAKIAKLVFELGDAALVGKARRTAGPCRVRCRVNVEVQRVTFGPIARPCLEARTIGHGHGDEMVVRMNVFFHDKGPEKAECRLEGGRLKQENQKGKACFAGIFDIL